MALQHLRCVPRTFGSRSLRWTLSSFVLQGRSAGADWLSGAPTLALPSGTHICFRHLEQRGLQDQVGGKSCGGCSPRAHVRSTFTRVGPRHLELGWRHLESWCWA